MEKTTKDSSKSSMIIGVLLALLLLGAGAYLLANRDSDDDMTSDNINSSQTAAQDTGDEFPLSISFSNLAPLAQGEYEGWVVRDDVKYSFGRFNVTEAGAVDGTFVLDTITPQDGDTVAISIEPENDTDPDASATIILAGEIINGSAALAFPLDVSAFAGQYILATPTTATTDDETAGLWFTLTGAEASLDIPVAPAGWAYEGWAVVDGAPISSGLFTDPSKADLFNGFSGPDAAPAKPGEDFVANLPTGRTAPLDLLGGTIVVSIEPFQDGVDPTGPLPAQIKPLSASVAADATDHTPYDLTLSTDTVPSGTASL